MKNRICLFSFLMLLVIAGCSSSPTSSAKSGEKTGAAQSLGKTGAAQQPLNGLNRELPQSSYSTSFVVQFEGTTRWTYMLRTRKTTTLNELSLHIEGIEGPNNPGDIRLVTDGKTSWVSGQGTDQECIQFPNGQGMDPKWIFPESLLSAQDLEKFVSYTGEENQSGQTALHFSGSTAEVGTWKNVKAEVWQEKSSQALLRYTLEGQADDPFFDAGNGQLSARYEASDFEKTVIEPVKGCEISVPLPDGASKFVRLPGMASFESAMEPDKLQAFYLQRLRQDGWVEKEIPALGQGSAILSYRRNTEEVEIHIEAGTNSGSKVKMLFMQGK